MENVFIVDQEAVPQIFTAKPSPTEPALNATLDII
jgi:hypothetical protein